MAKRSIMMRNATVATGLMIGMAALSGSARAADDGYQNVFSSVLGAVGLMPQEDHSQTIDYRERAPLVVPPKTELAAPEPQGAHRTAAWPQDPDVLARQKAEEEAHAPVISLFDKRNERPTSKAESMKYRAAQTDQVTPDDYCGSSKHGGGACRVSPYELQREEQAYRAANRDNPSDVVTAGAEPEREYLTQPPKGYLKVSKTVKATAEAPVINRDMSKPLSTLLPHPNDNPDN